MSHLSLDARLRALLARHEASGALPPEAGIAVSVLRDGDVVFKGAYGLAERDRPRPVTPQTTFEICSSTKAFLATAYLMASEEGRVDLERPINATKERLRLSDPEISRQVTIADLLSHRTGLPAHDLLWYFGAADEAALRAAVAQLAFLPGEFRRGFTYNNLGYGVLGQLFGELVGEGWEAYVARKILVPLGMSSTSFGGPLPDGRDVALPYVGSRRVGRVDMSAVAAAGAMRSNLEDMSRWMAFHLAGGRTLGGERLLSEASVRLMQREWIPIASPNPIVFQGLEWLGEGAAYGLGWCLGTTQGLRAVYHPGFIDGFSTALVMVPERGLGFVAMANVNLCPVPALLIRELVAAVLGEDAPAGPKLSAEERAWVGSYAHPAYGAVTVAEREGRLALNYRGREWPLTWKGDGTAEFMLEAFGLAIPLPARFEAAGGRKVSIPFALDPRVAPTTFSLSS